MGEMGLGWKEEVEITLPLNGQAGCGGQPSDGSKEG
jgi:hypothetical protein